MAAIPRLPIWLYFSIGILALAIGWAVKLVIDVQEDAKAEALLQPAPEAVLIEEFNPTRDTNPGNEVTIRAQLAQDLFANVTTFVGDEQRNGTFYGLFPVTALDSKRAIAALLLSENYILEPGYLAGLTVGQGPFGPIIEINGAIGSPSNVRVQIARTLEGFGRQMPDDVLTIVPFVEGREVALQSDPNKGRNVFMIFVLIGGIYIAYGTLRWYLRRGSLPDRD